MKIYDHNPIYTQLTDKYKVREYVAKQIGEQYLIPLLEVWDSFEQINFDTLPNKFVLKCNHGSGSTIICTDKKDFNYLKAKSKITNAMKRNYYYCSGEWQYKNIDRKIIAEEYISNVDKQGAYDYKFLCFDGIPYVCMFDVDRFGNHKRAFYDMEWNRLSFTHAEHQMLTSNIAKPEDYETMIDIAKKLSKNFKQVRIDLYCTNNHIYFGEMTFTNCSGAVLFFPDEYDLKLGNMWKL